MARAPVKKNRSRSKSSSSVPLPAILAGGGVVLAILLFWVFSSNSNSSLSSESSDTENPSSDFSLKMSLETFQEKLDLDLSKLGNSLESLEKVLEWGGEVSRRKKEIQTTTGTQNYLTLTQKIQSKIDAIAEQEYLRLQAEEQALIQQYEWEKAKQLWTRFPERLKSSPVWYTKAQEAPKLFSKKMEERFLLDVQELNRLIDSKKRIEAQKLRDQLLSYATAEQKQELEPIWTQLRQLEATSGAEETPSNSQKTPDRETKNPKKDPEPNPEPEDLETPQNISNATEKKAEALFLEAEAHLQKQEYADALKKLTRLQEEYRDTKFVTTIKSTIRDLYHQANIANAPEKDKFLARLQAFFKGNVSQVKGEKNVFQVEYDFLSEEQMEDFETKREDGSQSAWEFKKEGLFGTSEHALYWKPNLTGDIQVEVTCRPNKIDNVGVCIMASGYHQRYVFYPSLRDSWANWAGGDGAIVSTKEERYQSVKIASKDLGLARYKQDIFDASKAIYFKVQRKSQKNNADLLLWASKSAISPKEKPHIEGKENELDNGQVVLLGASGTLFTRLVIICTFDPGWLRQFR